MTNQIKRYDVIVVDGDEYMGEREQGKYVTFSDYSRLEKQLEAELAALKGEQVPVDDLQAEIKALMRTYALVSSPSTMAAAHDAGYAFVKAKGFNRILAALFTAPQKPVVLPMPFDINVAGERVDWKGGDYYDRDDVLAAIEAAGGIVKDGE